MHGTRVVIVAVVAALALAAAAFPPAAAARAPAMPSDFNGDGYADLAIGIPSEDIGSKTNAGAVSVLYGSRHGLTSAGDQLWSQDSKGVKGVAEGAAGVDDAPRDQFGFSLATADFNGDGYGDLAIGAREDRVGGVRDRGAVNVLYGSPTGLTAAGDQRLSRWDLPAPPDYGESFGNTMAAADFDGDGYGDLAVGGTDTVAGTWISVTGVFLGSQQGLTPAPGPVISAVELADGESALVGGPRAAGALDGDAYDDLVMLASGATGGAVAILHGSASGLATTGVDRWSQDSPGVPDEDESGDGFGARVALGDLNGDGWTDLAIGASGEDLGSVSNAGAVTVLYGTADGPSAEGSEQWSQASPGIPSDPAYRDEFGSALAICDFDGDGNDDLAVGVPREGHAGAFEVLRGSPSGVTATGARLWTQDTPGVPGSNHKHERFGWSLGTGNFGYSGRCDLAIGNPYENVKPHVYNAGRVTVLYGTMTGLGTNHAWAWSQQTRGIRGTAEPYDFYGSVLIP